MELEWHLKISSNALATLDDINLNIVELLPLTTDLIKLNNYLNQKLLEVKTNFQGTPTSASFSFPATIVLSKIILLNKRRSGEVSKMKVMQYASRPDWSQTGTEEFIQGMSSMEIELHLIPNNVLTC